MLSEVLAVAQRKLADTEDIGSKWINVCKMVNDVSLSQWSSR